MDFDQVPKLSRAEQAALTERMRTQYGHVEVPPDPSPPELISVRAMPQPKKERQKQKPKSPPKDEDPEFGSTY